MAELRVVTSVHRPPAAWPALPSVGRGRSLVAALVTATIVLSCSGAPPAASTATAGAFGPADVTAAVETLASAGVAVRIGPSDAPLLVPVGQSRVAMLRFQVRNLALEAHGGGGSRGQELDELAAENGGLPISYLIAAWARSAGTPAAAAASKLLGDTRVSTRRHSASPVWSRRSSSLTCSRVPPPRPGAPVSPRSAARPPLRPASATRWGTT